MKRRGIQVSRKEREREGEMEEEEEEEGCSPGGGTRHERKKNEKSTRQNGEVQLGKTR